jgi:hypothetical protein
MKRNGIRSAVSFAFSLLLLSGCQSATVGTNGPTPNAKTAESETVDVVAIETELLRIENDWPRIMKERDGAAARRVEADDVIIVYPDGSTGNREEDSKGIEAGTMSADLLEMADLKVKVLNKDAAVVTGRSILTNGKLTMPDGKTIDISGQYRFVDTFARRNGAWKLEAGIATPIKVPPTSPTPLAVPPVKTSPATSGSPAANVAPVMKASPPMKAAPAMEPTP